MRYYLQEGGCISPQQTAPGKPLSWRDEGFPSSSLLQLTSPLWMPRAIKAALNIAGGRERRDPQVRS